MTEEFNEDDFAGGLFQSPSMRPPDELYLSNISDDEDDEKDPLAGLFYPVDKETGEIITNLHERVKNKENAADGDDFDVKKPPKLKKRVKLNIARIKRLKQKKRTRQRFYEDDTG